MYKNFIAIIHKDGQKVNSVQLPLKSIIGSSEKDGI